MPSGSVTDSGVGKQIYIGGEWTSSSGAESIPVINPATEEVIAYVPSGSVDDADRAVEAARRAFEDWSLTSPTARGKYAAEIADVLHGRAEEIADIVSAEVGTPRRPAVESQVNSAISTMRSYAALARTYLWEERIGQTVVVRAPVGVVVAITPWNFPVSLVIEKVAPALVAGCPVILKPSEVAPLSAWMLAEAADAAGLPAGVFNLVSGRGPVVGEALVRNPNVDMVSFTGSTRAGKRILELSAGHVGRHVLEMGGKSANIVLDDADLDKALPAAVKTCFFNSGQVCVAPTRLLAPRSVYDEVVERVREIAESVSVGNPADAVDIGPVVSDAQRARVREYIQVGIDEGARLVTGGTEPPEGLGTGYYVRPTVFADVENSMRIAREEIFGPVLSIIAYDDEADAIRIANDSPYGLSGGVWSSDRSRAERVARALRTGMVRINGGTLARGAPFGGFKQSGIGRAKGVFGLDEYVEVQSISHPA